MGVKIAIGVVLLYVPVAVGVSFCFWDDLHGQEHSASGTIL